MAQQGKKIPAILLGCLILTIFFFLGAYLIHQSLVKRTYADPASQDSVSKAIEAGVDFLSSQQLTYGEFRTYACADESMTQCLFDSSPFGTTFVLFSLKTLGTEPVVDINKRGLDFLEKAESIDGLWSFFSHYSSKKLDFDLDTTSVSSYALQSSGVRIPDNKNFFTDNRDSGGGFRTFIRGSSEPNDVDCGINANILLYLGDDAKACSYVNSQVASHGQCGVYYPDQFARYYLISRAAVTNAPCLLESKDTIVGDILASVKQDGSFGSPLDTALAVDSLFNYGYSGTVITPAIEYLMKNQYRNGSWRQDPFFISSPAIYYYGSPELTTAFAIEALQAYRTQQTR